MRRAGLCSRWLFVVLAWGAIFLPLTPAQKPAAPMGEVPTRDARVTGGLEVQGDMARLLTNASVTANDRDAAVRLARGGQVLVCRTSEFHLLRSGAAGALVFGLDRGAVEISTGSLAQDAVLTPDLKFVPVTGGALDLKLRVTREGDTCVDNAGTGAPVLNVSDPFSSASYRILPGQHVLFVKGDLHRVVDHERSSCGCPAASGVAEGLPGRTPTAAAAAAAHPFPEAQSEGLAPAAAAANEAAPGTPSSQVTTTFSYGEGKARPPGAAETPAPGTESSASAPTASSAAKGGFFHAVGRFFHRLFHSSN